MTKYVDIDAVKEAVRMAECDADYDGRRFDAEFIENALDFIPAADVAPVVRCRDCIHKGWVQEPCHGKSIDYCRVWDCTLRNLETNFCSYGERKEGAEC